MRARVTMSEEEIRLAIAAYIKDGTGIIVRPEDIVVQVKSKQNYRSEWEAAAIRCEFDAKANTGEDR